MTSSAEAPSCPRCGEIMVIRSAKRGAYAGQDFWACPRFPQCWGKRGILRDASTPTAAMAAVARKPVAPTSPAKGTIPHAAGASAQAVFERRNAARMERIRHAWPVFVGLALLLMVLVYLAAASIGLAWLGVLGATAVIIVLIYTVMDRPQFINAWRVGAAGERKTASHLAPLEEGGYVVLHDRRAPAYGGNLDQLAIGPSGVWLIETKSLKGEVDIVGDSLTVAGQSRDKIIDQVYRQATAVQIALRDALGPLGVTVAPILCIHRARLPFFNRTIRGVTLTNGKGIAKLIRSGPPRLTAEQVQSVADAANRVLPQAHS